MKIERAEFRHAIADEMATLRAINAALHGPITPDAALHLHAVRAESIRILRDLLTGNYFANAPKKPVGSIRIREAK